MMDFSGQQEAKLNNESLKHSLSVDQLVHVEALVFS